MSVKSGFQYGYQNNKPEWDIELAVPVDDSSEFYKQSGGTNFVLKTVNPNAAAMFAPGKEYMVTIGTILPPISDAVNAGSGN